MKRFQSPTFTSKSKSRPPIHLDEKLAYMSQTLEELQESLVQEITVTDNLEQSNTRVRLKIEFSNPFSTNFSFKICFWRIKYQYSKPIRINI